MVSVAAILAVIGVILTFFIGLPGLAVIGAAIILLQWVRINQAREHHNALVEIMAEVYKGLESRQ